MEPFALNLIMILCLVVGSGLIITEAFIPGFGVAGISGIILEIVAVWAVWKGYGLTAALLALLGVLLLIGIAVFLSYRSAMKGRLSKSSLILKDTEAAAGRNGAEGRIGLEGVAVTSLRPAGFIEAGGERLSAASSGEFIEKGSAVVITGIEGDHFTIRRKT